MEQPGDTPTRSASSSFLNSANPSIPRGLCTCILPSARGVVSLPTLLFFTRLTHTNPSGPIYPENYSVTPLTPRRPACSLLDVDTHLTLHCLSTQQHSNSLCFSPKNFAASGRTESALRAAVSQGSAPYVAHNGHSEDVYYMSS